MKNPYYEVAIDEFPDNPREWGSAFKMVCWHRKYTLGDEQPTCSADEWLEEMLELDEEQASQLLDNICGRFDEDQLRRGLGSKAYSEELLERFSQTHVVLSLFLYDHSGLSMNVFRQSTYDSCLVGFIFISKEDARNAYGWKRITKKRRDLLIAWMYGDVETYDAYLRGEVYEYRVYRDWGEEEEDICGGYYSKEDCENEAKALVAEYKREDMRDHLNQLKIFIKNSVPLNHRAKLLSVI